MAWIPCSGRNSVAGLVWLPRLLEKARHCEGAPGGRLVDGYCYGNNDFIDKDVIAFLRTDDAAISKEVRAHPLDADAARVIVERSGRSAAECAAFSAKLSKKFFNFVMLEADEGRLSPGAKATLVAFLYNNVMMPIVYPMFRHDERKREPKTAPGIPPA
jgi:hypothetical protein